MTVKAHRPEQIGEQRRQTEETIEDKSPLSLEALGPSSAEENLRILNELQAHRLELEMQNEELFRTQGELEAERARYFDFYDLAPVGYFSLSEKGLIVRTNLTAATLLGEAQSELIRQPISRFIFEEDQDIYYLYRRQLFETDEPQAFELRMVKKDKTMFWAHLKTSTAQDAGGAPVCRIVLSDVSERKLREDEGELAAHLITQINTPGDFRERISGLTASLQGWSGCEAVGIRLRFGKDFPYYETRGFPSAFIDAETHLCAYGPDGELLRDSEGEPILECLCGNILCGRFDPSKPFFTAHGSFWTNNTSVLTARIGEAVPQTRIRNRCNTAGYESVALIPLRVEQQVFGLLQFNDHRSDRFTSDLIGHFERMADTLAIALSRRQAEAALQESEERFRAIIDNSTAGYFFIDREGYFKTVNTAWLILHKYDSPAEILGRHFSVTQVDLDQTRTNELIKQLLAGNVLPQGEFTRRCKDNSIAWHTFSINPVRQGGKLVGIEGFLIDITKQKKAEEALRQSEEKYRTVADFTHDMETWRGPDGRYRYVSPSCDHITGHTVAEFLADPDLMVHITHPDDRPKVFDHYLKTIHQTSDRDLEFDFRILTPGGEVRWIRHSCTAVFGENGQWLGRRENNRDISKRKRAEEEKEKLEVQNRQLQKAESLGRMAGAIAHHFNNKLHAVMGHLELAMRNLPKNEKALSDLNAAMQAADQAAEVSRLMLTYLGQVNDAREPLDLAELCKRSLPLIQAGMPKNVILESDLLFPGPAIKANANQIQLILTHLISNSWEAVGDDQGSIQLTVKRVSSADIAPLHRFPINWQADGGSYACLAVRDTGCGLAAKDIEEAFDPFFSTKFTGRGLGLSVVLGLVQSYGGVVTVESTPGHGSVFQVFFPISAENAPHKPDKSAKATETQGAGSVLLVDDDRIVLDITTMALSALGYTVLSAMDGVEAVKVFRRHMDEIRLVLTDFAMPRMNGLETLTALRRISPGIPVILASGYSEEQVMDSGLADQPQAFLGKPYGIRELKAAIQHSLADEQQGNQ